MDNLKRDLEIERISLAMEVVEVVNTNGEVEAGEGEAHIGSVGGRLARPRQQLHCSGDCSYGSCKIRLRWLYQGR
ncbi:hypothetical protein FCV25MIE_14525, partial [Fagus crenata]